MTNQKLQTRKEIVARLMEIENYERRGKQKKVTARPRDMRGQQFFAVMRIVMIVTYVRSSGPITIKILRTV